MICLMKLVNLFAVVGLAAYAKASGFRKETSVQSGLAASSIATSDGQACPPGTFQDVETGDTFYHSLALNSQ